jgi:hypothetical protein
VSQPGRAPTGRVRASGEAPGATRSGCPRHGVAPRPCDDRRRDAAVSAASDTRQSSHAAAAVSRGAPGGDKPRSVRCARLGRPPPGHTVCRSPAKPPRSWPELPSCQRALRFQNGDLLVQQIALTRARRIETPQLSSLARALIAAERLTARKRGRGIPVTLGPHGKPDSGPGGDSTDAHPDRRLSQPKEVIHGTLLTRFGDSADANRSYPEDSTDEANNQDLISFE